MGYGSGVYAGKSNTVNFDGCDFSDNVSGGTNTLGGAIYVGEGGTASVNSCTFTGNGASNGGAIAVKGTDITVTDSTFTDNNADAGAAIYVQNSGSNVTGDVRSDLKLSGSTVTGGNAKYYGGGVYALNSDVLIEKSNITGNTAVTYGGGGVYGMNSRIGITGSNIDGNTVTGTSACGAGIYNYGTSAVVEITASSVSGNTGAAFGGGMYNAQGRLTATNSTIDGNSATYGGAICNFAGATTIKGGTVQGNSASFGGGLYNCNSTSAYGVFAMTDGTALYNNTATKAGDDILNWGGKLTLVATGEMGGNLVLDEDGKPITGWYIDGYNGLKDGAALVTVRWGGDLLNGLYLPYEPVAGDGTILALKAAHGYISEDTTDPDDDDDDATPDTNVPVTGGVTEEIPLGTPDEEIPLGVPTTGDDAFAIFAGIAALIGMIFVAMFIMKRNRGNSK